MDIKKIMRHYINKITLSITALAILAGAIPMLHIANAQSVTGSIKHSKDNVTFTWAANVGISQNSDMWIQWEAQNATDCMLWMDNVETNKTLIGEGDSGTAKIDTSVVGSFHYSYRCDDPNVAGINYVQVSGVSFSVSGTVSPTAPPTVWINPYTPECVFGYPKSYGLDAWDPNGDPFRIELEDVKPSGVVSLPSASTYFTSSISGPDDVTFNYPYQGDGAGGVWRFPRVRAIDNKGNATEWQDVPEWSGNNGSYDTSTANEQLCVWNLDEGLLGGDNDGTDLVVSVNGTPRSATNISIQNGDQISFKWRSELQNCSGGGPGTFFVLTGYGTGGEDTTITEPPPGESYTYMYSCNTIDFIRSETIVVTNTSSPATFACTNLPVGAIAHDLEESSSLTSSLAWAYAASDTASRKCEYKCDTNYSWNGSSCGAVTPQPQPTGLSLTLGSYENGVYQEGDRNVGTGSYLNVSWSSTEADVCYYSWSGVFRGTSVNSGLGSVPPAPTSDTQGLFPPPRYVGDYVIVQVSCLDSTHTQSVSQSIRLNTTYIGNDVPNPSASMQARKYNGSSWGPWTSGNLNVAGAGEQVQVRWTSSNADDGCVATAGPQFSASTYYDYNANLGPYLYNAPSGSDTSVTTPKNGQMSTFTVQCSNSYGNFTDATVTVTNTSPNTKPNPPTITGTTTGYVRTTYTFGLSGTDPDGGTVRYLIDRDNDGDVDDITNYGTSGWVHDLQRYWDITIPTTPPGQTVNRTFCVQTDDGAMTGGVSDRTCHTITLGNPPPPKVDLKINGYDDLLNVYDYYDDLDLTWTVDRNVSCIMYGPGITDFWGNGRYVVQTGSWPVSDVGQFIDEGESGTYRLRCAGVEDTVVVNHVDGRLVFQVKENSGNWSRNNITVDSTSNVYLGWAYSGSGGACEGTNFTIPSTYSSYYKNNQTNFQVTTPSAGQDTTYTIRCGRGVDGRGQTFYRATASIKVTSRAPARPNLISENLSMTSGTVQEGNTVYFQAMARNNGTTDTGAGFNDVFEYRVGGTRGDYSNFTQFDTESNNALAANSSDNDSAAFTIPANTAGQTIFIQYCVDHGNVITESNENVSDNCHQTSVTVDAGVNPNLVAGAVGENLSSIVYDVGTDTFDNVRINFVARNVGSTAAASSEYKLDLDYGADGSYEDSRTGTVGTIAAGSDANTLTVSFDDVPQGQVAARLSVNTGSSPIAESSVSDNVGTPYVFALALQDLGLSLTANPSRYVRNGQNATINWAIGKPSGVTSCTITGSGAPIGDVLVGGTVSSGSFTTPAVRGKLIYTFTCLAGINSFDTTMIVESTGSLEEI